MSTTVTFEVPGAPQGKARPRFRVVKPKGKPEFVHVYTPAETMGYEKAIAWAAKAAMRGKEPMTGPVELCVTAVLPVPVSWSIKKRNAALVGDLWPTGKPDFDNIEKVVADAVKGIVWKDDSQVCTSNFRKRYGKDPGLAVEVHELDQHALPLFRVPEDATARG